MKNERQERILEIVTKYDVQTQEEITERLRKDGYKVTQATVSRDLKELKLTKSMSSTGKYRYVPHHGHDRMGMVKLNTAMLGSITGVKYSLNSVVIKTYPGLAGAVASGVAAMNLESILGCVAGDDTIIVITTDVDSAAELSEKLKEIMRGY